MDELKLLEFLPSALDASGLYPVGVKLGRSQSLYGRLDKEKKFCSFRKSNPRSFSPWKVTVLITILVLDGQFLGAFAKLRKATISFFMSVCLSVRMEQLGSHWTDVHEILYFGIFRKSVEKIKD
jgi:hypothetical protein